MFLIRFIRFLLGYVRFEVCGGFPERFLNLCAREGISIWGIERVDYTLSLFTPVKHYRRLRPLARKTHMRPHVCDRHGLPFVVAKFIRRKGFLIGVLLFFVLLGVMSRFIWSVDVEISGGIPRNQVMAVLNEMNIHAGVLKNNINTERVKLQIMQDLPQVSWVGIKMKGSSLVVEVRQKVESPTIVPDEAPCNLRAALDGQIVSFEVYDGQNLCERGMAVAKGDLLVSGLVEDKVGNITLKHARAKIIARTRRKQRFFIPMEQTIRVPTGSKYTLKEVEVLGFCIPLHFKKPSGEYDCIETSAQLTVFDKGLPLWMHTTTVTPMKKETVMITKKEAQALGQKHRENYEQKEMSCIQILSREEQESFVDNGYILTVYYTCEEEIGYEDELQYNMQWDAPEKTQNATFKP